ncbi:MAG: hypothetical protein KatS3mg105_3271 [Gemmatales bacterium]|nr:MAG: hypothetical protein KatS3mg105_3271 [Gemmatales bacterium]
MTAIQKFVSSSRDTTVRRQIVSDPTNAEVVSVYLAHLERRLKAGDVSAIHFKACKRDLNTFLQFQPADCKVAIAELTISESRNADLEDFFAF